MTTARVCSRRSLATHEAIARDHVAFQQRRLFVSRRLCEDLYAVEPYLDGCHCQNLRGRFTSWLRAGTFGGASLCRRSARIFHSPICSAFVSNAKHFLRTALSSPFPAHSGCSFLSAAILWVGAFAESNSATAAATCVSHGSPASFDLWRLMPIPPSVARMTSAACNSKLPTISRRLGR